MEDRLVFDLRYFVGIEQVDREHEKLFELAGKIYDCIAVDIVMPMSQIKSAIIELIDYTRTHFANEEALMEAKGYPGLDQHRELHAYLLSRIKDFERSVKRGEQVTPVDAYDFLCSWLGDHIQTSDRNFGEFVSQQLEHRSGAAS